jgi:hypothetical protein
MDGVPLSPIASSSLIVLVGSIVPSKCKYNCSNERVQLNESVSCLISCKDEYDNVGGLGAYNASATVHVYTLNTCRKSELLTVMRPLSWEISGAALRFSWKLERVGFGDVTFTVEDTVLSPAIRVESSNLCPDPAEFLDDSCVCLMGHFDSNFTCRQCASGQFQNRTANEPCVSCPIKYVD